MIMRDGYKKENYFIAVFAVEGAGVFVGMSLTEPPENYQDIPTAITPRADSHFYSALREGKKDVTFDMLFSYGRDEKGVPTFAGGARSLGMLKPVISVRKINIYDLNPNGVVLQMCGQVLEQLEGKDSKVVIPPHAKDGLTKRFSLLQ